MAPKTTSKTAAKPAVRKTAPASKTAGSKGKVVPPKKREPEPKPAARAHTPAPAKASVPAKSAPPPGAPPAAKKSVASVSLIDKQPAHKKTADGDVKRKTTVLPP